MQNLKLRSLFLLLATAIFFGACDSSKKEIVGKWKSESGSNGVVWEFLANGTLSAGGAPGRYTFGDGKRIKVQTQTATFVNGLEVHDDHMTWTAPDGSKQEFARVK